MGITHNKQINYEEYFQQNIHDKKIIKNKILQGIQTSDNRLLLWSKLARIQKFIKMQTQNSINKYQQLSNTQNQYAEHTKKDIPRTFPDEPQTVKKQHRQKLFKVLTALANRFPQIGYRSGMNFFASRIIQLAGEQKAFWILNWLFSNDNVLYNLFTSEQSIKMFFTVIAQITQKQTPKLNAVLKHIDISIQIFASTWIKTLFSMNFDSKTFYMIFSLALLQGPRVWIFAVISMIKCLQQKILKSNRTPQKVIQIGNSRSYFINVEDKSKFKQQLQTLLSQYENKDKQYVDRLGNKITIEEEIQSKQQSNKM